MGDVGEHMSAVWGRVTYFTVCPQGSIWGTPVSLLFIKASVGLVNEVCKVMRTMHHAGPVCTTKTAAGGNKM